MSFIHHDRNNEQMLIPITMIRGGTSRGHHIFSGKTYAKWSIRYIPCNHKRINAVSFAQEGDYDAPFPFDCPVSKEEKALVTTASGVIEEG